MVSVRTLEGRRPRLGWPWPTWLSHSGGVRVGAFVFAVLLHTGAAGWAVAQGGPPLETDDPGTPGGGHVELNVAVGSEREDAGTTYDAPRIDANFGVGARVQVKAELPWRVATARTEPTRSGIGSLGLGVKWRFADRKGFAASTYPQVTFGGSDRTRAEGIAESETVFLPLELAWYPGPVSLDAEVGYELGDGSPEMVFGLAVSRLAGRWLELLGECHAGGGTDLGDLGFRCGAGFRWELRQSLSALGAFGVRVGGPEGSGPDQRWYTGAQLRW